MYSAAISFEVQAAVGPEPRRGARADGEDRPGGEFRVGRLEAAVGDASFDDVDEALLVLVAQLDDFAPVGSGEAAQLGVADEHLAGACRVEEHVYFDRRAQPLDAVGHHCQPGVELAEEVLHDRRHDRIEQALLRRQVVVQAAHLDPDLAGDGPQAGGLVAVLEEQVDRRRSDQLGGGRLGRRDGIHGHGTHLTNAVVHVTRTAFARELLADCHRE